MFNRQFFFHVGKDKGQEGDGGREQQPGEVVTQVPRPHEADEDAFHGSSYGKCPQGSLVLFSHVWRVIRL